MLAVLRKIKENRITLAADLPMTGENRTNKTAHRLVLTVNLKEPVIKVKVRGTVILGIQVNQSVYVNQKNLNNHTRPNELF
jgi:hypothetical protein